MDELSATFAALADPSRRAILARLALGDAPVGELARPLPISGPAVSRHLRVLERAGLVERAVDARWRVCSLRGDPLRAAHGWLEPYRRFWQDNLDRLAQLLEAPPPQAPLPPSTVPPETEPPVAAPPDSAPRRRAPDAAGAPSSPPRAPRRRKGQPS